ncbi:hypothetical protein ACWCQS_06795 [Streptomyces sp. NPDC002076]
MVDVGWRSKAGIGSGGLAEGLGEALLRLPDPCGKAFVDVGVHELPTEEARGKEDDEEAAGQEGGREEDERPEASQRLAAVADGAGGSWRNR